MKFLLNPPQFLFFTGKGGVGKTSVACATAVTLAEQGKRVLLVSTDPASNVGQVLGLTIGNTITAIDGAPGLSALEIDPEQAAEAYRPEPPRSLGPTTGTRTAGASECRAPRRAASALAGGPGHHSGAPPHEDGDVPLPSPRISAPDVASWSSCSRAW